MHHHHRSVLEYPMIPGCLRSHRLVGMLTLQWPLRRQAWILVIAVKENVRSISWGRFDLICFQESTVKKVYRTLLLPTVPVRACLFCAKKIQKSKNRSWLSVQTDVHLEDPSLFFEPTIEVEKSKLSPKMSRFLASHSESRTLLDPSVINHSASLMELHDALFTMDLQPSKTICNRCSLAQVAWKKTTTKKKAPKGTTAYSQAEETTPISAGYLWDAWPLLLSPSIQNDISKFLAISNQISTSKNESVDRLVPTYLSSMESGVTMRDSCISLSDRRIGDVPCRISDVPRQISDRSPTSDIADKFGSQIVLRTEKDA